MLSLIAYEDVLGVRASASPLRRVHLGLEGIAIEGQAEHVLIAGAVSQLLVVPIDLVEVRPEQTHFFIRGGDRDSRLKVVRRRPGVSPRHRHLGSVRNAALRELLIRDLEVFQRNRREARRAGDARADPPEAEVGRRDALDRETEFRKRLPSVRQNEQHLRLVLLDLRLTSGSKFASCRLISERIRLSMNFPRSHCRNRVMAMARRLPPTVLIPGPSFPTNLRKPLGLAGTIAEPTGVH
jgi:hypothetical protein